MARKIFISYRRQDAASSGLAIAQYLGREFGKRNVFIDVDMRAGSKFPAILEAHLGECKALVAAIGPGWVDARNDQGHKRLDDPDDWVRLEITKALSRDITIIPVLVDGAELPNKADLPDDMKRLLDYHAVRMTASGFRNEMAGLARDIRAIPDRSSWTRFAAIAAAGCIAVAALLSWLASEKDPQPPLAQYDRLLGIVSGSQKSACVADTAANGVNNVQVFENGWLLIRFSTQTIYAIARTEDNGKVLWASHADDSALRRASCPGVQNEDLLQFGFRYLYCKSTEPDLKSALGKPLTGEIGALVQYQEWSGGLLAYGLPGSDAVREKAVNGTPVHEAFTQLVGIFMNNSEPSNVKGFNTGRKVEFTFHNAEPANVYCTALWYPAQSNKPIPDDLKDRKDCHKKIDATTYGKGHERCLIFGFE
jgi:hypothetical protein